MRRIGWGAMGFEVQAALETLGWRVRFWAAQARIAAQDQMCDGASEGGGAESICLPGEGGDIRGVDGGAQVWVEAQDRDTRRRRLGGWWRGLGCQATVSGEIRQHNLGEGL